MKNLTTEQTTLTATGTWPATEHRFDQTTIEAIRTAYQARRPLLIRGEPGSGKSQLARAAAQQTGRAFVSVVVNSRTESADLHYHFDAIARLADAQAAGALANTPEQAKALLNPHKYLSPGPLWWVFNWQTAQLAWDASEHKRARPMQPDGWQASDGAVILVDEIDKAETDLPNDLLETFGNGAFSVPWVDQPVTIQEQAPALIIVTTNDERELPAAFVRRCVVLHLDPPADDRELKQWLVARGKVHFGAEFDKDEVGTPTLYEVAADLLIKNRHAANGVGVPRVGQAEYLDLLRALSDSPPAQRYAALERISTYVLKKYPEML